jgi:hypothetical protein
MNLTTGTSQSCRICKKIFIWLLKIYLIPRIFGNVLSPAVKFHHEKLNTFNQVLLPYSCTTQGSCNTTYTFLIHTSLLHIHHVTEFHLIDSNWSKEWIAHTTYFSLRKNAMLMHEWFFVAKHRYLTHDGLNSTATIQHVEKVYFFFLPIFFLRNKASCSLTDSIFKSVILIRKSTDFDIRENVFVLTYFISFPYSPNLMEITVDLTSVSTSRVVRSTNKFYTIIYTHSLFWISDSISHHNLIRSVYRRWLNIFFFYILLNYLFGAITINRI